MWKVRREDGRLEIGGNSPGSITKPYKHKSKKTSKQKTHEISSQGCGGIQLAKSLDPGNFILWDRFLPTRGRRKGKVGEE